MARLDPRTYLAHFTSARIGLEFILPTAELLMNPYGQKRDPLENKALFPHVWTVSPTRRGELNLNQWMEGFHDAIRQLRDQYRLLSFSQGARHPSDGNERVRGAWTMGRMWESYGDNHHGVCLLFDREALLAHLHAHLGRMGYVSDREVDYTIGGFAESRAAWPTLSLDPEAVAATAEHYVVTHFPELFYLKTSDWASEHEYRVIFRPMRAPSIGAPFYVSHGRTLRHVIVGDNYPYDELTTVKRDTEIFGVELWRMHWASGSPGAVKADDPWWKVQDSVSQRRKA